MRSPSIAAYNDNSKQNEMRGEKCGDEAKGRHFRRLTTRFWRAEGGAIQRCASVAQQPVVSAQIVQGAGEMDSTGQISSQLPEVRVPHAPRKLHELLFLFFKLLDGRHIVSIARDQCYFIFLDIHDRE